MLQQILQSQGLSPAESSIYSLLIEQGDRPASFVAKQLGLSRSSSYAALEKLISHGLICQITRQSISYFSANDPLPVLENIKRKRVEEVNQINTLKLDIQLRQKTTNLFPPKANAHYFVGVENIQNLISKVFSNPSQQYRLFLSGNFYVYQPLNKSLLNTVAPLQILTSKNNYSVNHQEFSKSSHLTQIKTIHSVFDLGVDAIIAGDQIAVISSLENFGILIQSRLIAKAQSKVFDFFWRIGAKQNTKS